MENDVKYDTLEILKLIHNDKPNCHVIYAKRFHIKKVNNDNNDNNSTTDNIFLHRKYII